MQHETYQNVYQYIFAFHNDWLSQKARLTHHCIVVSKHYPYKTLENVVREGGIAQNVLFTYNLELHCTLGII